MRILNLYSGLGGNRESFGNEHQVTSVEINHDIADVYKKRFPRDHLIIGDAHSILIDIYKNFDFIWSSPPCQSHSQYRYNIGVRCKKYKPLYPDMTLYQEIIFLKYHFSGKWIVENTAPYYNPLIKPTCKLQRHFIWSNFEIPNKKFKPSGIRNKNKISSFGELGELVSKSNIKNKRQALRNLVDTEVSNHIFKNLEQLDGAVLL